MCRLFGLISTGATPVMHSLWAAPNALRHQAAHAPHGWGIWTPAAGVVKEPCSAAMSARFRELARATSSGLLIAHLRWRTIGEICEDNTQPFAAAGLAVAHSGGLGPAWHKRIRATLGNGSVIHGATSGEFLLHWLTANPSHSEAGIIAQLAQFIQSPAGIDSATCIIGYEDKLLAFNYSPGGAAYNPLYYVARRHAVLVASRPTTPQEAWTRLDNATVLIANCRTAPAFRIISPECISQE